MQGKPIRLTLLLSVLACSDSALVFIAFVFLDVSNGLYCLNLILEFIDGNLVADIYKTHIQLL